MKIAHIFNAQSYLIAESYIRFIRDCFPVEDHDIIVVGKITGQSKYDFPANLTHVVYFAGYDEEHRKIFNHLRKYDKILLHSLSVPVKAQARFLANPSFMNKLYWVAWGNDLYNWKNQSKTVKAFITNRVFFAFRKHMSAFVGIFPPDIDFYRKIFNARANCFYASYTGNLYNPFYKQNMDLIPLEEKIANKACINIQIGHASSRALNHLQVLDVLERFKDENIRLFIPLSYGDTNYGDLVCNKAHEIFGEKAVCLRELMPKDAYMKHLAKIDIALFNAARQIGLGNISPMLFMEKKIYMPKGSVMYDFYQSQQINICDYNEIRHMKFNDFISPVPMREGRDYLVNNELNVPHKIKMWSSVFDASLMQDNL